ncbi:MAG: lamin tail domain-containing protein [Akkermansiaceae bacterium]|nr:lamin tail domain-containing protein [Akkermansiaceae bacterium]
MKKYLGLLASTCVATAQVEILSIEFNQDDQAGFDLWPSAFSGTESSADFTTDTGVTSGTTTVAISTSSGFGVPGNRGSSDGSPPGYSYQRLYEDLLIATSPTGALTLDFSGLNPNHSYQFVLFAWDPGASNASDKVWTVTSGTGDPVSASVNFQDALVDNDSFAMVFEIETTASGAFQVTNTAGLPQSAINGFRLSASEVNPDAPPEITAEPTATWDGGDEIKIEVEVVGADPLSFQWYLDGVAIPGATLESLTLNAEDWDQAGDYTVRVSNANGFVISEAAEITIDIPKFPTREELSYEPLGPSSRRSGITISEVLYHPAQRSDGKELEFIELFNSQPWAEDVSGWRLSGDVDFVFPNGSEVPGEGFLVVARVPENVESEYVISGVAGPWEGNLSNQGGRIRLRKPSDAIVQELNYNDEFSWPAAADGAGHSLILARASYGENDVRAWEASHAIGGSPGSSDTIPSDDLDQVFVSSVLANSEAPAEDFVELRNGAPYPVDLSGCGLSDARDSLALFEIPAATTIPAGGTIRYTESELGFSLSSGGDAVYLTDPDRLRILDAVVVPASSAGVPFVRPRSDAPLRPQSQPSIVINELMFHPPTHDDADEWIEIHNTGLLTRDLSGWTFTDGIDFVIPNGTQILAGGFLVIAKDRARTLANHPGLVANSVVGDYEGTLSDAGERVALSRWEDGFLVVEDEVSYRDSDRWHRFSDGRGATLERRDSGAGSFGASNWVDSDESAKAGWTTVEFNGTLAHGNSAAPADQVQMFLLGPGEALVDQVEVIPDGGSNILANGDFESGTSGWFFQGNQRRSQLETGESFEGSNSLKLVASRRGDPGPNRARTVLSQTLSSGSKATLRARVRWLAGHPEFILRFRGNWLEAAGQLDVPANLGTPGAVNSQAVTNAGPQIEELSHRPILPAAGEDIHVYAQVSDFDGIGAVTLRYRIDPSSSTADLPMNDDGTGADLTPGDGIYSASIPGQASGSLVAFKVLSDDVLSASASYPPDREALVRVGEPDNGEGFGTYRMWITEASLSEWDAQPFRSNDPFPITFVYNGARAIYDAGAFYGGNKDSHSFPTSGSVSYDVTLPEGDEFLGADKLTLDYPVRDVTNQREQLMHWFADRLKLPTLHRRDVYLYMNGIRRRTIYHDAEQPDGVLANSHYPGDKGELFKTSNDNETSDSGVRARPFVRNVIDVFEADGETRAARYRWTTGARARGSRTRLDDTSIIDLVTRADDSGPDYEKNLLEIIDMENWMRTWALIDLASFWDAFGNPNWKNTYLYKPNGGKWVQFTWDFDVGLGVFNDPVNQGLFPSNVDANLRRMYDNPTFVRAYWRTMEESFGNFFSGAGVTPTLEKKRAAYADAGLGFTSPFSPSGPYSLSVPNWIDQRAAFILPQLNAVNEPFQLVSPTDGSSVSEQTITLSGRAPVGAVMIDVNGIPLNLDWISVGDWSAPFVLQPGENLLLIRALDLEGMEIASEVLTLTYTGVESWPSLVINEWMASNQSAVADPVDDRFDDWIELANPGLSAADLSGWFLSDDPADLFKFQIPDGFNIPGEGYLRVWADDEILQNDLSARPDLHVPFKLGVDGESILLSAPDGSLIDRVDFGRQSPDKTMGLSEGEIAALAFPSPGAANGRVAVDPSATYSIDGNLITFSVIAEPGFLYEAEVSGNLENWEALGSPVLADSTTLPLTDVLSETRRFYRFRRLP